MEDLKKVFAGKLLGIKAIKLQPNDPFKAVAALREAGFEVVGMVASYTYGFPVAEEAFREANVKLVTLTDYEHVVEKALETGYIKESEVSMLHDWRKDPANWKK